LLATLANRQVSINYSREVALDAVVILEGHHLPREFETFEPEDDQILTNLLEFEALHEESYSSALDLKELIESVR